MMMREYEVEVVEELISTVCVEASDEDEAYEMALQEMAEGFSAPCHNSCDVIRYKVTPIGPEYEMEDEDEL